MTSSELGKILNEMYENAPKNEQVAHIHLFGIKYGDIITKYKITATDIISDSNLPSTYHVEVSKGIKLSKYFVIK